jgi:putative membrane protein insertion efficiency factor
MERIVRTSAKETCIMRLVYDASSYRMPKRLRKALATVSSLPAIVSVTLIRIYQRTLSLDHGPLRHLYPYGVCRHEPTCSEFAIGALNTASFGTALWLTLKRIASCHPWTKTSDERLKAIIERQ